MHLSAGVQVGGVLEPVGAIPVIIEDEAEVYDVGTVLQVGDGIARVYGLSKVAAHFWT